MTDLEFYLIEILAMTMILGLPIVLYNGLKILFKWKFSFLASDLSFILPILIYLALSLISTYKRLIFAGPLSFFILIPLSLLIFVVWHGFKYRVRWIITIIFFLLVCAFFLWNFYAHICGGVPDQIVWVIFVSVKGGSTCF